MKANSPLPEFSKVCIGASENHDKMLWKDDMITLTKHLYISSEFSISSKSLATFQNLYLLV
jgi:hypothetical protein